jgi:cell division protein FtsB
MTEPAGPREGQERPRFTSKAAVLAVVVCAIALSLAYPVREYVAQRRQIDQLDAQQQVIVTRLKSLEALQRQLSGTAYIERQARDKLHMCLPTQTCYVIIAGATPAGKAAPAHQEAASPWYQRLWSSVQQADRTQAH